MTISSTESNLFLKKFINDYGKVDYKKLKDNDELNQAFTELKNRQSLIFNSKDGELTFWINCYNLLVLQGVLNILEKNPSWNGTNSYFSRIMFFIVKKYQVGPKKFSLYHIENKILRDKFKDPRIHFVINCASTSCPVLPNSMLNEESLNTQLEEYTKNFINNENNVLLSIESNQVTLNPIFKWYKNDFKPQGGIIPFIKKYHNHYPTNFTNPKIKFQNYNWSLNKQ